MMITVDVISDTVCPWCLIGKRKLEAALTQRSDLDVSINWHPFQLHPDMPKEGMDRKTAIAAKFGSLENAQQLYQRVAAAGLEVDVAFKFDAIPRTPNTLDSHRLIYWAGQVGVQDAMVEILFNYFFLQGKDIGDHAVLLEAAVEAGMDVDVIKEKLASEEDLSVIRANEQQARQLGVEGVPFFVFNRKYALSGAQPPEAFLQVFDTLVEEEAKVLAE